MPRKLIPFLLLFAAALFSAQTGGAMHLTSSSFSNGGSIPKKYTCDGSDASPALAWSGAPQGTQSFALIADDPDAPVGTWSHWVLYDLAATTTSLPENISKVEAPPTGGHQGRNDFRKTGYGGPCPPPGTPHRYFFKLYAVDRQLNLKSGASQKDVEEALKGHILAQAELMGKYGR
jgi:Raf kinase inhibitor-like YbhB/YbcL family protein